jgi:hypothetical protein
VQTKNRGTFVLVIYIRRFNNCKSIIKSTEANILIFARAAGKEDGFNNSPRQYRSRFVCFSSFL